MDINALFPSSYLKASDLQGQVRRVVIEACQPEQLGQGEIKPALQFRGVPKKLILNKTNALVLAASFGSETTAWAGREIELYPETIVFQGQAMPAIRVRVPIGAAAAPAAAMTADPFAHAAPAPQAPAPAAPQPPQAAPPSIPTPAQQPPAATAPAAAEPAPAAPQQAEQAPAAAAPQQQQPEQAATPAQAELPINW